VSQLKVTPNGSTAAGAFTVNTSHPRIFRRIVLMVRDARGRNYDFVHRSGVTISAARTFSGSRTRLPVGTYRARVAYSLDGARWVNTSPSVTFTVSRSWTLAFRDEFNDDALDTAKWRPRYPRPADMAYSNWNNGEAQWYKPANISEGGGSLSLTARRERTTSPYSGRTFEYTSGLIQSKPSFNFRYGRMAARMKLPKGSGFWPAFWTWPSDEVWPPEIDAMEFVGDKPNLIYQTYHGPNGANGSRVSNPDWTADWHTFSVDWQPGRLTWYVDGIETKTIGEAPTRNMYLIANLAVANGMRSWGPPPDASTPFPASLRIDYVRVWKR
jgi:beta-glucanase (GH16 family)